LQQNSFSDIEKKNSVRESTSKQIQFQEKQLEIKTPTTKKLNSKASHHIF
jgi:hypothetical protein